MTFEQLEQKAKQASRGDVVFAVARSGHKVFIRRDKMLSASRYYEFESLRSAAEFLTPDLVSQSEPTETAMHVPSSQPDSVSGAAVAATRSASSAT